MNRDLVFGALLLSTFLSSVAPAGSEVIHGFAGFNPAYDDNYGFINDEAFDFSTQAVVPVGTGDLAWGVDIRGLAYLSFRECYVALVTTPLGDIEVAPPLTGPLGGYGYSGHTYVIRTSDGRYAKFRSLGSPLIGRYFLTIEYYVQTDGSPTFGPSLPVKASTWGSVKALYR